ncbi:sigma-54 dependent transcriptional regulator, partial [Aduncisulcus paluster]
MQLVFRRIGKAAATNANVLISGDSGTGKELVARAVHYHSDRRAAPGQSGFFEIANGGTVFLDEIGDASPNMQAKLLRILQSKEYCKVGSSVVHTVDTRILAATHKDLKRLVEDGSFREDLYYRLHVVDIPVPSLAERGDDILILISNFLVKFSKTMQCPTPRITD